MIIEWMLPPMKKPILALFLNGLFLAMAHAAEPAAALYKGDDPAASYLHPHPGMRSQFRKRVNAAIQKNPKNSVALSHRAYLFLDSGDMVRAKRDFDAALNWAPPGGVYERHVLWSRGWAEYDLGDYASTLRDWQRAEQLHGGRPYWVTYSYALVYWTLDDRQLALDWFGAAVASIPEWGTDEGFSEKVRHWRPAPRGRMQDLFEAWKSQPGSAQPQRQP